MKTLDEVIKALEWCVDDSHDDCDGCPYDTGEVTDCHERNIDALHYLKEYRDKHEEMLQMEEALGYCEMSENRPLTWDELKTMEGKPVWVESHGDIAEFTGWAIVRNALEDRVHFIFSHYDGEFLAYEMTLPDVTFGKKWNVYRKERTA